MHITNLLVEYLETPCLIGCLNPRFSWKIKSEKNDSFQESYHIIITHKNEIIWDSTLVYSDQSHNIHYAGVPLKEGHEYNIEVSVTDNNGNLASYENTFETTRLHSLEPQFITYAPDFDNSTLPVFTKTITLTKEIKKAMMYVTALGIYDVYVNNQRVSDTYFAPGWTNYKKRLQVQAYSIDQLKVGENTIEITVAPGWYRGVIGFTRQAEHYGNQSAIMMNLFLDYSDNSKEIHVTDTAWKIKHSQVTSSEIYYGEHTNSMFTAVNEFESVKFDFDPSRLISQESEPVRITQRLEAIELITTPKGETVLDFGQNLTGLVEFTIKGTKDQKVVIHHAETLDKDGNFYPDTLRSAISQDHFILDGTFQTLMPRFTFHGFRYIRIEGLDSIQINKEDFVACVMHSDLRKSGEWSTSHPLINQLQSNIYWSQRDNFLDIPTDCPQRDERLGWTGDAQVFAKTALFNQNAYLFFRKWLRDLASEQSKEFGVPHIVPNILGNVDGAAGWSDAAVTIPWDLYWIYGDERILSEQYESMKGWIDYITSKCNGQGLWQDGFQYGDWLALDKEESSDRTGATDVYFIANAYFIHVTKLVSQTAEILGFNEDQNFYSNLANHTLSAFRKEYITETGRLVSETQTACILSLKFNLIEEKFRNRVERTLYKNILAHKNHLATGFIGTPLICHALSDSGYHDLAGQLLLKDDYPSWLYAVKKGATTIWERWNSILPNGDFDTSGMNSLNHYAFGAIGDWMYRRIGGLQPLQPGYKTFKIAPTFIKGIHDFSLSFDSIYGQIESHFSCKDGFITGKVAVPFNTNAVIILPDSNEEHHVGSGEYEYHYASTLDLSFDRFDYDSTLGQLLQEPIAVAIFQEHAPQILSDDIVKLAFNSSINQILSVSPSETKLLFDSVLSALNNS